MTFVTLSGVEGIRMVFSIRYSVFSIQCSVFGNARRSLQLRLYCPNC
jgi:hypothetical protein